MTAPAAAALQRFAFLALLAVSNGAPATPASAPKLMILMQEKVMGVLGTTGFEQPNQADASLAEHFRRLGFRVVDPATVRKNITQAKGLRLLEGDDTAAAAVGLQHGSEYSLVGTAISKPAGAKLYGTQLQSIHATLTARLVRNADARVLATASATGVQAHVDEVQGGALAIEKAARQLAEDLQGKIPDASGSGKTADAISLNITGLVSYRHLDYLMGYLEKETPGIETVALQNFSSGVAELGVQYDKPASNLARHLATHRFTGFRLEPTLVTEGRMDVRAIVDKR